jgi:hypothetical protein
MPPNVPETPSSRAISGAAAGTENSAIVASVCTAKVAVSGHTGMPRSALNDPPRLEAG